MKLSKMNAIFFSLSQAVSIFGSSLSAFALNIWIYKQSESVAYFAALSVATILPGALMSVAAGALVDRTFDKRKVIAFADAIQALCTLAMLIMYLTSTIDIYLLVVIASVGSIAESFQWPAIFGVLPQLAEKDELLRVNSILETGRNISKVGAPASAGLIMGFFDLSALYIIDILTFFVSFILLFRFVSLKPNSVVTAFKGDWKEKIKVLLADSKEGFAWIMLQKDLTLFLGMFVMVNVGISMITIGSTPFFLSFMTQQQYGWVMSAFFMGLITSGLIFSLLKIKTGPVRIVLVGIALYGFCEIALGLNRSYLIQMCLMFSAGFLSSLVNISSHTLWQRRVPSHLVGRVFAFRKMLAWGVGPLAALLTVPLSKVTAEFLARHIDPIRELNFHLTTSGQLGLMITTLGSVILLLALIFSMLKSVLRKLEDKDVAT